MSLMPRPARSDTGTEVAPAPAPSGYVAVLLGTTLMYASRSADLTGPAGDTAPAVGLGYGLTDTLYVELDIGTLFDSGHYMSTSLVPALLWVFHNNFFLSARFIVGLHPTPSFTLFPGFGAMLPLDSGLAPFLELNALSNLGSTRPDIGLSGTLGVVYLF